MGTVAKRLGQLSRMSLETESANILKTAKANKVQGSLSLALDGTLKGGHDMRTFGLGTLASMSNVDRYKRFTQSMFHVYTTMEEELDKTETPALKCVWKKHGQVLRRSDALFEDLRDVMSSEQFEHISSKRDSTQLTMTDQTRHYVNAIRTAGERDRQENGGSLIGHLYCRYFADLFGGQMLGPPYNWALGLQKDTPRHFKFDFDRHQRREFIERLYMDINEAGTHMSPEQQDLVVQEALGAFRHNVDVYAEEPVVWDSIRGAINIGIGFAGQYLIPRKK